MAKKKPAPTVPAKAVLRATLDFQRLGADELLCRLEIHEPELAEYVLETLSALHHGLLDLRAKAKPTRRAFKLAERLVLVSILAVLGELGPPEQYRRK